MKYKRLTTAQQALDPVAADPETSPPIDLPSETPASARPVRRVAAVVRPAALGPSLTEKLQRTVALVGVLVVGAGLWRADGAFTLDSLSDMGLKIAAAGGWRWLIPATVTMMTIAFWPKAKDAPEVREQMDEAELRQRDRSRRWALSFFLLVVGFNMGTSFDGFSEWAAGRSLPLFTGLVIPKEGIGLWIISGVVAAILAFVPEKLWRWAFGDLKYLWWDQLKGLLGR